MLPLVASMVLVVTALQWWSSTEASKAYEAESEALASALFTGFERSIAASGGSAPRTLESMLLDGEILDGVVIAGPDGDVVAATNEADRDKNLATLTNHEVADDLIQARSTSNRSMVFEHGPTESGDADVLDVYGILATPVRVSGGTDYASAAVHLAIDVSETRAAVTHRRRSEFAVSLLGALSIAAAALLALRWAVIGRLQRLAANVAAIGAGNTTAELANYGTDAIGALAASFRQACERTTERNAQLAQTNRWLEDEMGRRHSAEAQNRHQARHDALTGLANRILAVEATMTSLSVCDWNTDRRVAAVNVNLDRFKLVNDSLGHGAGDKVLREIARRLLMSVGTDDIVARINGDEFLLIVDERREPEVTALAESLIEAMEFPIELGDGNDVFGSASVGVALGRPGDDAEMLFHRAGLALSRAKERGRARYEWFDEEMAAAIAARAGVEAALRHAIQDSRPGHSELELHYQPIIDLALGRVRGFESLVRWRRDGTLVSPVEFVQIAEDTGLILPLGEWILKQAAAQAGRWQRMFSDRPPTVTINVSGRQLAAGGVPSLMRAAITANRLDPKHITIELTESVLLDDIARARAILDELKALGVNLAIDDFGTGYSSLTYLRQFPIDVVKVDQSFVRHLGDDSQDSTIVAAVVAMARALGLRVVCEGVETAEQVAALMMLGADDAQGWFFAKALETEQATSVYANGLEVLDRYRNVTS